MRCTAYFLGEEMGPRWFFQLNYSGPSGLSTLPLDRCQMYPWVSTQVSCVLWSLCKCCLKEHSYPDEQDRLVVKTTLLFFSVFASFSSKWHWFVGKRLGDPFILCLEQESFLLFQRDVVPIREAREKLPPLGEHSWTSVSMSVQWGYSDLFYRSSLRPSLL